MKTPSIVTAALIAATSATAAYAAGVQGEATYEYPRPAVSAASRADVRADAIAARHAGLPVGGEHSGVDGRAVEASTLTRDEVLAQLRDDQPYATDLRAEPHGFTVDVVEPYAPTLARR